VIEFLNRPYINKKIYNAKIESTVLKHGADTGREVKLCTFLTSAVHIGECSASRYARFAPGKKAPVRIGEGPGLAPEPAWTWYKENSYPCLELNHETAHMKSL
jgi:hypothetical protein